MSLEIRILCVKGLFNLAVKASFILMFLMKESPLKTLKNRTLALITGPWSIYCKLKRGLLFKVHWLCGHCLTFSNIHSCMCVWCFAASGWSHDEQVYIGAQKSEVGVPEGNSEYIVRSLEVGVLKISGENRTHVETITWLAMSTSSVCTRRWAHSSLLLLYLPSFPHSKKTWYLMCLVVLLTSEHAKHILL